MNKKPNVVFMGTPEFAVPSLEALHSGAYPVLAVVTQPDRPKGRGRKPAPPPVKAAALQHEYPVVQPSSVREPAFLEEMNHLAPDLFVVIAYGHILPKSLLDIPRLGAVNLHASLLPAYRGSAPIQRALINGETETGVTAMMMDQGMDTGDILHVERLSIHPDDTAGILHDRLSELSADALLKVLEQFEAGTVRQVPQKDADASYAPMLRKEDGHIDWHKSAEEIRNLIRGVTPWPGAFTFLEDRRLKIFRVKPVGIETDQPPGTVLQGYSEEELLVATGSGVLSLLEIQGASGKKLWIADFLRGCTIPPGTVLR